MAEPTAPAARDPLLDAVVPALALTEELRSALVRLAQRRASGWTSILVGVSLEEAITLHAALAEALNRLGRILTPEVLAARGLVEPATPKVARVSPLNGEGTPSP